ncbi:two-component system response regulator DcuR [Gilliamella apicola]|jgi:Response regulator of citrate/malate metabolism|uniref:Transcriptional regulatory protein n=1 Tax=Gilliamella apicola TaxID=1196095 RepID=A0A556SQ21_9GAMM|nr:MULTISPECIES: response regulator [Gilliamella]MBI0094083.1 response regulator [Gilliamella sp. W8136]MCT6866597.1 response regulator [Gilliamella apicola]OTP97537.1 two-component system response regulator DcuR [Gilliamella apicola]OTQ21273.1 two-component system response regulator DcuR [Gilliamella apicola]TSK03235.1 response regulator [Gilliamella apicola]
MIEVLIVEDDPMVAELNKKYLQMISGFNLIANVNNGEQALHFIHDNHIDLILLDVFMPKLNGLELLQHIRISYPQIDIIMVTAACNTGDIQTALRLGVIDYIVKPFTFERLRTALISYQERIRLLSSSKILNQHQLDDRIFAKPTIHYKNLPKGIDSQTLKKVREVIISYNNEFSMSDIVELISLSRISLKKYLDYLEELGELESYLTYLSIGRPVKRYIYQK